MLATMEFKPARGQGSRKRPADVTTGWGERHLLTSEKERELSRRVRAGDRAAREEMIVSNLPLVIHIASQHQSSGMTRDDLIQEAVIGLIRAVEKFDPDAHGTRFSTYAVYWICQAIQRALARSDAMIRIPDYIWRLRNQYSRVSDELRNEEDDSSVHDEDDSDELARRLGISQYRLMLMHRSELEQCTPRFGEGFEEVGMEELVVDHFSPERELERAEQVLDVRRAVDALPAIQAWVIRHHFGLPEPNEAVLPEGIADEARFRGRRGRRWTYRRMARVLGTTLNAVRYIEETAIKGLRKLLSAECLRKRTEEGQE